MGIFNFFKRNKKDSSVETNSTDFMAKMEVMVKKIKE